MFLFNRTALARFRQAQLEEGKVKVEISFCVINICLNYTQKKSVINDVCVIYDRRDDLIWPLNVASYQKLRSGGDK